MSYGKGGCIPDAKGTEHMAGRHVGGFDEHVHGKDGKPHNHGENVNNKAAFVGEKKVTGVGGEAHSKYYSHLK